MSEQETVTIPKEEYESLLRDSDFLSTLEAYGVDGWEGYEDAYLEVYGYVEEEEEDETES
jgi:hypothetical protein